MNIERQIGFSLLIAGILLDVLISVGFNPPKVGFFPSLSDNQVFGILGVVTAIIGVMLYTTGGKRR